MNCSGNHGAMTRGVGFWICLHCGERVVDEQPRRAGPIDELVPRLPQVLAVCLDEYVRATQPYVSLHRLTAAAETITRFCTVVALADILDQRPSGFPASLRKRLVEKLDRPTFGAWRELLAESVRTLVKGKRRCILPELPAFVRNHLEPLLDDIIPLRNRLAHSGRLSEADEQAFAAKEYPRRLEEVVAACAFFGDVQVIGAPVSGQAFLLRGVLSSGQTYPPFDLSTLPTGTRPPEPDRLLLFAGGRVLDLFPLHAYGDVFHYVDKRVEPGARASGQGGSVRHEARFERLPEASPTALLYFRRGVKAYVEYTAFSTSATHSQVGSASLERFCQVFRIEEWRHIEQASAARREFDFSPWCAELRELFVGREAQIQDVVRWVKQTPTGLCWIHGHPGVGKSAFMAELTGRFFSDSSRFCKISHFFRATDPRCNRMKFLEGALLHLFAAFDRSEEIAAEPRSRAEQFARVLLEISTQEARKPPSQRRQILFLLDAIDEVAHNERDFQNLVFQNLLPGVLWVCAGRAELGLGDAFVTRDAHLPFGAEGLPVLTDGDVRAILDRECGREIYELIARDTPEPTASGPANPFLAELVRRSAGLPIYLRLLVQDVREGRVTFREGEEKKLPRELGAYYERILERLQVSDVAAVLTPVLCLLAVARAPLTLETILALMEEDRLLREEGGAELLRSALDFGHLMLRRVTVTEPGGDGDQLSSEVGFTLYHGSFHDHLLESETVMRSVSAAKRDFTRFVTRWQEQSTHLFPFRYLLRHGAAHLIAAGEWGAVTFLLTTLRFLEEKAEAGMVFDLVEDMRAALASLPATGPDRMILQRLEEALSRDVHFIGRHPTSLFQCMWNSCWWYDCQDAAAHHAPPLGGWPSEGPPWERADGRLSQLLESWRASKMRRHAFTWLRSLRPPSIPLGGVRHVACRGHQGSVRCAAYGPHGRWVVSGGSDHSVMMWDSRTGEVLQTFRGHTGEVAGVATSLDGQTIASTSRDGTVRLWGARSGMQSLVIGPLPFVVQSVSFSCDGRTLAGACGDKTIRLWDVADGVERRCLVGHQEPPTCVTFSSNGMWLGSAGGRDRSVRIWRLEDGAARCLSGHAGVVTSVAFSHDSSRIAAASLDRTVLTWDIESGTEQVRFDAQETGNVMSVSFSPDDGMIATGSGGWVNDHSVRVWHAGTGAPIVALVGHEDDAVSVSFSPDGASLVSASSDGTVRVWQLESVRPPHHLRGHEPWGRIETLALSPDGAQVVTASLDKTVRVWCTDTGVERYCVDVGQTGNWANMNATFSPDGKLLVTVEHDVVRVRLAATGAELLCLRGHRGQVSAVSFLTDGSHIVTGGALGSVRVWDAVSGAEQMQLLGHSRRVTSIAVSADDQVIATAAVDATVRIWRASDGEPIGRLDGDGKGVECVAISPDGRRVAARAVDGSLRVWDSSTRELMFCVQGDEGGIRGLAYSADGQRILSATTTPAIRQWSAETGELLEPLPGWGDLDSLAQGVNPFPLRAIGGGLETVVADAATGDAPCWFPADLRLIRSHPNGRCWAGSNGGNLYLFRFEVDGAVDGCGG